MSKGCVQSFLNSSMKSAKLSGSIWTIFLFPVNVYLGCIYVKGIEDKVYKDSWVTSLACIDRCRREVSVQICFMFPTVYCTSSTVFSLSVLTPTASRTVLFPDRVTGMLVQEVVTDAFAADIISSSLAILTCAWLNVQATVRRLAEDTGPLKSTQQVSYNVFFPLNRIFH